MAAKHTYLWYLKIQFQKHLTAKVWDVYYVSSVKMWSHEIQDVGKEISDWHVQRTVVLYTRRIINP